MALPAGESIQANQIRIKNLPPNIADNHQITTTRSQPDMTSTQKPKDNTDHAANLNTPPITNKATEPLQLTDPEADIENPQMTGTEADTGNPQTTDIVADLKVLKIDIPNPSTTTMKDQIDREEEMKLMTN